MNAIIGSVDRTHSAVADNVHPPVMKTMVALVDNGILKAGLILAKDSNGEIVPYDPADVATLKTPVGVLAHDIDTSTDDAAVVIVHGTVALDKLLVDTSAPDADDLAALEAITIWAQ